MIGWAFVVVAMAVLSYLGDVGVITVFQDLRIPVLGASLMSVLLMLCGLGMMSKVGSMVKKGEKESLKQQVTELEKKLKEKESSEGQ